MYNIFYRPCRSGTVIIDGTPGKITLDYSGSGTTYLIGAKDSVVCNASGSGKIYIDGKGDSSTGLICSSPCLRSHALGGRRTYGMGQARLCTELLRLSQLPAAHAGKLAILLSSGIDTRLISLYQAVLIIAGLVHVILTIIEPFLLSLDDVSLESTAPTTVQTYINNLRPPLASL